MTTDTTATLARMDAARIGPHITCPVSRHAAMMAEAMMRGEPYVMMDEDRAHCGASIGDTVASLWEARAEIERLRGRIENAGQAASETHPSWERRCYAITSALGLDYGEPTPDIPEQSGWYARKMKQMEDENFRLIAKNAKLRAAMSNIVHTFDERSDGSLVTFPGGYYQQMARAALGQEGGA